MSIILFSKIVTNPNSFEDHINNFRIEKDAWMQTDLNTPFSPTDLADFPGLYYFPINSGYRYNGTLFVDSNQNEEPVSQEDGNSVNLIKYGVVECTVKGIGYALTAYQNINLPEFPGIPRAVFVPFKDASSDVDTFSSGRYLILRPQASGNAVQLDFNMAVNPFADYNNAFSGLVTSSNNVIEVSIIAGERKFNDRTRGDD